MNMHMQLAKKHAASLRKINNEVFMEEEGKG
jgi:hypothetical protein